MAELKSWTYDNSWMKNFVNQKLFTDWKIYDKKVELSLAEWGTEGCLGMENNG